MSVQVSVLMPVYNAEQYLAQAIESILNQSLKDFEFIIINDYSTDNSDEIIKSYTDQRIKYFQNDENLGLIKTLNKGIELCSGNYIARMDSDDVSMPHRLAQQVDFMDRNIEYGMCGGNAIIIDKSRNKTGFIKNLYSNELLKINLLFSVPFVHPCVMFKREVFSFFQYDINYKHVEDYDLWCRIAEKWKVANIPNNLLQYRWHDSNISVVHEEEQEKTKQKIICRELEKLDLSPSEDELFSHQITFKLYAKGIKQHLSIGDISSTSDWFSKLIAKNNITQTYKCDEFIAYLWARWTILCISQRKFLSIIPSFAKLTPQIIVKWLKLIYFFSKK